MRRSRRRAAAVLLPAVMVVSTGCSGGEDEAAPEPQRSTSPSASPTSESATPTPKPTPSASPLSRFEDEPPVEAARAFAAGFARSVNDQQRDLAQARALMTEKGRRVIPALAAEDIDRDLVFPGPLPFTPVGVEVDGARATVPSCIQLEGFAQSRATKLPAGRREIAAGTFFLRRTEQKWKVEDMRYRDGSCRDVSVKGVGW